MLTNQVIADVRLSGKGNSNSHGLKPVNQIISMMKWIRTSRFSTKNSLCLTGGLRPVQIEVRGCEALGEQDQDEPASG